MSPLRSQGFVPSPLTELMPTAFQMPSTESSTLQLAFRYKNGVIGIKGSRETQCLQPILRSGCRRLWNRIFSSGKAYLKEKEYKKTKQRQHDG